MNVHLISPLHPDTSEPLNVEHHIAYCARVSNPTNQMNISTNAKLLQYMVEHKHWSPFEMHHAVIEIETTRDIARQILRHRSFSFQEFCVSGETLISLVQPTGKVIRRRIDELYEQQNDAYASRRSRQVRVLDDVSGTLVPAPIREVFRTGEKPVFQVRLTNGKTIKSTKEHKFLTQSGFRPLEDLTVGDVVGCNGMPAYQDEAWLASAKQRSETAETVKWSQIESIQYVGIEMTYDIEVDHVNHNYVANGFIVHNSQRYADPTTLGFELREPRLQDTKDRQNSLEVDNPELEGRWLARQADVWELAQATYAWALASGIAKEVARAVLPEGMTTSRIYMAGTLRSWFHYCELRTGPETQKEHREIAQGCAELLAPVLPALFDRFI